MATQPAVLDALAWLDAHFNVELAGRRATPTLGRIAAVVELLGRPQRAYPLLHITGTNGKTSVTRMVARLLQCHGLSVGTYTSPHLERVNERITWNGEAISDEALAEVLEFVAAMEPDLPEPLSYFEVITAAAYRFLADVAVDAAVVEVGMGGTWDATNVADGTVAMVTNVGVDHTEYLGMSRASIAAEKSGIVKPGATLVLGEPDPALRHFFLDRDPGRVLVRDEHFGVMASRPAHDGQLVDLRTPRGEHRDLYLPLHGAFQADNAACAVAGAEAFLDAALEPDVVVEALAGVRSPGRLEVVGHQPLVLLDGAHNGAGAEALRSALDAEFPTTSRTVVVGLLREKDPVEFLEALGAASAARVVVCSPPTPRALEPGLLAGAALEVGVAPDHLEVAADAAEALARALTVTPPDGQVVITGSLYLVGEARSALVTHSEVGARQR
ncbi:MAG: bifunctional folylpolyglutamate synthase/dihydrofolate synthase [Acidimicrobiia bacterium]